MQTSSIRPVLTPQRMVELLKLTLLIMGASVCVPSFAYDDERAKANMAQELMGCMSFYNYWAKSDRRDNLDDKKWIYNATWALTLARVYEPNPKKLDAMADLAAMELNKIILEEGSARLSVMRAYPCKSILERPTERFVYWRDKN